MGNLKFGEISTLDLDLVIQAPPVYTFPEKDVEVQHIPGRNGDIILDNGCYQNVERTYSIASVFRYGTDFVSNAERIIQWLTSVSGYQRLEDSYDPEVYRLAQFKNDGSLTNYYDTATVLNVTFDCKPQRFLKIGEKPVNFSGSEASLRNPTLMPSEPEITISNIDDIENVDKVLMLNVSDYKGNIRSIITLSKFNYNNVVIDSEKQLVYTIQNNEKINIANYINLNQMDFPKFYMNENSVKLEKYNEISTDLIKYSDVLDNNKLSVFALYKPYESLVSDAQESYDVKSYLTLIEDNQEVYDAEAYANLCLDQAIDVSIESFNNTLQKNAMQVEINTSTFGLTAYINTKNLALRDYHWGIKPSNGIYPQQKDPYSPEQLTKQFVYIANSISGGKDIGANGYLLLLRNEDNKIEYNNTTIGYGAFVSLEDVTDSTKNSKIIKFVEAVEWKDIYEDDTLTETQQLIKRFLSNKDDFLLSHSIIELFPEAKGIANKNHDIIINVYKAKYKNDNGEEKIELDVTEDTTSDYIGSKINYVKATNPYTGDNTNYKLGKFNGLGIDSINYYNKKIGYYYKSKDSSGGILSSVFSVVGKLLNTTGWSHIDETNQILETVKWDSRTKAFVYGSLLSQKADYTIERKFIEEGNIPTYQDIILEDTFVEDENGNPKVDSAGNKINKIIPARFKVNAIDGKITTITSIQALSTGFYKILDSKGNYIGGSLWKTCSANQIIDFHSNGLKTNQAYKFLFIDKVPDYKNEKTFPEWLDPVPVLYTSPSEEAEAPIDKLNSKYYDFKVVKKAYYRYTFYENNIFKLTEFALRDPEDEQNNILSPISPESQLNRKIDEVTTINMLSLSENSDEFPINKFEYVFSEDDNYVLNQNIQEYNSANTYNIDDLVKRLVSDQEIVYKCKENNVTGEFDSSKWIYLGLSIKANPFDENENYYVNDYCIYDRKLYRFTDDYIGMGGPFPIDDVIECGEYIKDVGFYYLNDSGKEVPYPGNLPIVADDDNNPSLIVVPIIKRGTLDDYSDTLLEFYPSVNGLYKWDTNTDWIRKENSGTDYITAGSVKSNTYIYYISEPVPTYDESSYYNYEIIQNVETGNPESVTIKAKIDGFYKVGNSSNYVYKHVGDILKTINIYESLNLIYLEKINDSSLDNVKITVVPRWWKL